MKTKEECYKIALKFKSIERFAMIYKGIFILSIENGWLYDICQHMVYKKQKIFNNHKLLNILSKKEKTNLKVSLKKKQIKSIKVIIGKKIIKYFQNAIMIRKKNIMKKIKKK